MSRNNDVFQVLIPNNTGAPIAPGGTTLDDLALGQLGAFDYETNLAIDAPVRNFYFAVGVGDDGAGNKTDINKSSGTHIQTKNVIYFTNQCYVAPVEKVVELSNWVAMCDTEYGIRFEIRNQEAYRLNGYNQVVKYYTTVSPACVPCDTTCPDGDCYAVAADLMDQINNDPDAVITATAVVIAGTITIAGDSVLGGTVETTLGATTGDPITAEEVAIATVTALDSAAVIAQAVTDSINATSYGASLDGLVITITGPGALAGDPIAAALVTATGFTADAVPFAETVVTSLDGATGSTDCPTLVFTVNPATFSNFCDINLNYFFPRQTDIIVVGTEGFVGNSTIETTTEMVYEDGAGYDVKQLEYEAGGWNGKPGPYRVGELIGVAFPGFEYYADQNASYDMIHIQHDQNSVSGWRDDNHFERTIIATDIALGISDTVGAFINSIIAVPAVYGEVDPIVACIDI